MRIVKLTLLASLVAIVLSAFVSKPKDEINWMTFAEMQAAYAKEPRPIIVDMYTNWCGWCKQMDKLTYTNEKVVKYINENYYAIKFDAESKETIQFNAKQYAYNSRYKSNELALYLSSGRLEFPTTVFLSSPSEQPAPLPGYMRPKELEPPLKYFVERENKEESFIAFNRRMKKEW